MPKNPHPGIPWMNTAYSLIGTKEVPGPRNNQEIMLWAKVAGLEYSADAIPWCGLFVTYVMDLNGIPAVAQPLWALNWKNFGSGLDGPAFGCVMVFQRTAGGHVGLYVSESKYSYNILGGNQSDQVSIAAVAKNRCVGKRWPPGMGKFLVKGRVYA